jgi:hypothetical protein
MTGNGRVKCLLIPGEAAKAYPLPLAAAIECHPDLYHVIELMTSKELKPDGEIVIKIFGGNMTQVDYKSTGKTAEPLSRAVRLARTT